MALAAAVSSSFRWLSKTLRRTRLLTSMGAPERHQPWTCFARSSVPTGVFAGRSAELALFWPRSERVGMEA